MAERDELGEGIRLLEKSRKRVDEICKSLESYERRVQLQSSAISELQDLIIIERRRFDELTKRVDRLEKKFNPDVMYQ